MCTVGGAKCGILSAAYTCGGQPVDCGTCSVSYDLCGDNQPNVCSHTCLEVGFETFCGVAGVPFQPTWSTAFTCATAPYRFDSNGGRVIRANGLTGCVGRMIGGTLYWCCP